MKREAVSMHIAFFYSTSLFKTNLVVITANYGFCGKKLTATVRNYRNTK